MQWLGAFLILYNLVIKYEVQYCQNVYTMSAFKIVQTDLIKKYFKTKHSTGI